MSLTLTLERGGSEVSGSGTNIELEGTIAGGAIESVEMLGDTTQQTYTGKNKFQAPSSPSSVWQLSYAKDSDNSFTLTTDEGASVAAYGEIDLSSLPKSAEITISFMSNRGTVPIRQKVNGTWGNVIVSDGSGYTFTTGSSSTSIAFYTLYGGYSEQSVSITNMQIETGSQATTYEPYVGGMLSPNPAYPQNVNVVSGTQTITVSDGGSNSETYTLNLGSIELCKIGTYQDYIYKSGDDWYIHKGIGRKDFDENDSFTSLTTAVSGRMRVRTTAISTLILKPATSGEKTAAICNYFIQATSTENWQAIQSFGVETTGNLVFYSSISDITQSPSNFTTWLSSHNLTVYYALATPTDTQITDSTLIGQLNALNAGDTYDGTTLITVSSENLAGALDVTVSSNITKTYTEVEIGSPFTIADVEGKSSNTTLDGNVYVDWAYNKKQYSFDLFNLTPQDYADIRAFYDYQFNNSAFPTITVPELNIERMPVYMEISSRNIINKCLLTDKLTIKFRETVQP